MDVTCAQCGEPWDVDALRHEGADLIDDQKAFGPRGERAVERIAQLRAEGREAAISKLVYRATLSGHGCPLPTCGFGGKPDAGPYREQQLREIVIDGVTDDDPMMFM